MLFTTIVAAAIAPLVVVAAPVADTQSSSLITRQAKPVKPAPCVRNSSVNEEQTKARSETFAKAFIYDKDISKAFTFIAADYIVR